MWPALNHVGESHPYGVTNRYTFTRGRANIRIMVDTRVWGAIAILLTLVAVVLIGPDLLHSITEGHVFVAAYGIAAVLAAVITLLIIGGGIASSA